MSGPTLGDVLFTLLSDEVQLIRRTHRVGFSTGYTVARVIQILSELPSHATLEEWIDWTDSELNAVTLEFNEQTVKQPR